MFGDEGLKIINVLHCFFWGRDMSYERLMKKKAIRRARLSRSNAPVDVTVVKKAFQWDRIFKILGRVELLAAIFAIPIICWVGWNELESMADQRRVNAWQLLSVKAEGNSGKIAALEYLNQDHYCLLWSGMCLLEKEPLVGVSLERSFLVNVNLPGALLFKADLRNATLADANLSDAFLLKADLSNADLSNADLSNATLSGANLSGADLSFANLSNADLNGANLSRADLTDANLSFAYFIEMGFSEADHIEADFTDTDLTYVNLSRIGFYYPSLPKAISRACVTDLRHQPRLPMDEAFKDIKLKLCPKK